MEIYLKDVCKIVYANNELYYTYDEEGRDINEFDGNYLPIEISCSKVQMIESSGNKIIFYIYD